MGDFTSVGGQKRQQIFMLRVGGSKATVTRWSSPLFSRHCITREPFYIRAASWSPDDSKIYIGTTGRSLVRRRRGSWPLTGLCDVAAAFPAIKASVRPIWINYTGCDSLYSTAADARTAYFGGHPRWSMNPDGCDHRGPGSYSAKGLQGLSPTTGALYLNSSKSNPSGYYERSRGVGADDMLLTRAGLWIASDNFGKSESCGFVPGLSGICFLPYGSSRSLVNQAPPDSDPGRLASRVHRRRVGDPDDQPLRRENSHHGLTPRLGSGWVQDLVAVIAQFRFGGADGITVCDVELDRSLRNRAIGRPL
jgi:hypothetical protein